MAATLAACGAPERAPVTLAPIVTARPTDAPMIPITAPVAIASAQPAPLPACPDDMVVVLGGASTHATTGEPFRVAPFCLDRFEVTVRRYLACVQDPARQCPSLAGKHEEKIFSAGWSLPAGSQCNAGIPGRLEHPVNCVTWDEAVRFCASLQRRLPNANEWEIALIGPDSGRTATSVNANVCTADCAHRPRRGVAGIVAGTRPADDPTEPDGWPTTAPVGSFPFDRSPDGALDMLGNVREWTADAPCTSLPACRPEDRVALGDSWFDPPGPVSPNRRRGWSRLARSSFLGFRCAWAP